MPTIVTIDNYTTKYNQSFSTNGELYFIKPFGYLFSVDASPALSCYGFQNVYLGNAGWIINNNAGGIGVAFANSTGVIENSGHIYADIGVSLATSGFTLTNDGVIESYGAGNHHAAVSLGWISQNSLIDNYGYIHGSRAGIQDSSHMGGNHIDNSRFATIAGDVYGIDIDTLAGKVTHVGNDGTIKGGTAAIISHNGGLDLVNVGTIDGPILLNSNENDTIWNYGVITGAVKLGNGSDTFEAAAGKTGTVYGQAGDDFLLGSPTSADTLIGGYDSDTLNGHGGGNDTLMGGTGSDTFVFDTAFATAGITKIIDFAHGVDKIWLDQDLFVNAGFQGVGFQGALSAGQFYVGSGAHDAGDRIIYNPANGYLLYDTNGNAAGGVHHFATLATGLTLTNTDFLVSI